MWTEIFGMIIGLDTTWSRSNQGREIYTEFDVYRYPKSFFNDEESPIADSGLQKDGQNIVFPLKNNQGRGISQKSNYNNVF